MNDFNLTLPNEANTIKFGKVLALKLTAPLILSFSGEIGVGKTTLIRALIQSLGITTSVKSPTFSLLESYECSNFKIHHFDLYRIAHSEELEFIGFRDYFKLNSICCIEWPEKAKDSLAIVDLNFSLSMIKPKGRLLSIKAATETGKKLLLNLQNSI